MSEHRYEVLHLYEENPSNDELLQAAKEELGEMSKEQGEIVFIGTLAEVFGAEHFEGSVSLKSRIESGEITKEDVEAAVELFERSYVETTRGAAKRCVDGRGMKNYNDGDIEYYGQPLGPQVQGGTVDEAAAKRLDSGYEDGATLIGDTRAEAAKPDDFAPGSHDDEHSSEGCGAVKGQEAKLAYYQDAGKFKAIKTGTNVIEEKAGRQHDVSRLDHLPSNAKKLLANKEQYFGNKVEAVNAVREVNPNGKVTLDGVHNEAVIIVNFIHGTTLHTNHVVASTEGKIEAFGLDAWDIDNPAVTADAIATLMNLTDGTLRLCFRVPREELLQPAA